MDRTAPKSRLQALRTPGWIVVVVLTIATATHLTRTALRANENLAVLTAIGVFIFFLVLKAGRQKSGATLRKRPYIPWSAIPVLLLGVWAANARLFGFFDVSAVLFHLKHSLKYDGVADDIVEFSGYLVFAFILIACISYLAKRDRRVAILERIAALVLLLINPVTSYAYDTYLNPQRNALDLTQAYQPVTIGPATTPPKNLILIYLESMESTFAEPVFGDVFDDMTALSGQGLRLTGVTQIQDTGWTIAGLVATQCGLPLLSYGLVMKNRMKNIESFLPNAECLATQLAGRGYQTRYYGGAGLTFSGKGKFLSSHGYQSAVGLDEIPVDERGELGRWGVNDDRLFDLALGELTTLSEGGAPYLLSVLTLGAHAPAGHPAPVCFEMFDGAVEMDTTLLSVKCTARLLRGFLEQAEARGLLDNTVVVVMNDHLAQKNTVTRELDKFERENFVLILDKAKAPETIMKTGSMIDVYPTILESIGLPTTTGKAGLGVSLLGTEPTLVEQYGKKKLNLAIRSDKRLREQLWNLTAPDSQTVETP